MRAVKKNCTIPLWLNFEAEKAGDKFFRYIDSGTQERIENSKQISKERKKAEKSIAFLDIGLTDCISFVVQ